MEWRQYIGRAKLEVYSGGQKEIGGKNAWKKRTKTEMALKRRMGWSCGTSCLEVRHEQSVSAGIGSEMELHCQK